MRREFSIPDGHQVYAAYRRLDTKQLGKMISRAPSLKAFQALEIMRSALFCNAPTVGFI